MNDYTMTVNVMKDKNIIIEKGTTYEGLAKKYQKYFPSEILLARNGNELKELSSQIDEEGDIDFYDIHNKEGYRVYNRSLSFLLVKAVKELFGRDADVDIENSLGRSFYCEFLSPDIQPTPETLRRVEDKMREYVQMDLPICKQTFSVEEAIHVVRQMGMPEKAKLFEYRRSSTINLYSIEGFFDYYYGYMVPSTGYLKVFGLEPFKGGFLLKFPDRNDATKVAQTENIEKLSNVFLEQMEWCRLMRVKNVCDLNQVITEGKFGDLIRINEALHEKKIAEIADMIKSRQDKVKVVLIAGPSSSGKTTFCQRLCVQMRVNGLIPHPISLDDYFLNREDSPRDEFGKPDFETIYALDLKQFNEDMTRLVNGERVELPHYNFVTGFREYKGNFIQLKHGEILVIEGIHGLNHILTQSIKDENKFKIFISAMTQLNVDNHNRISTSDTRLIRRIVRDYQFRNNDASKTISQWDGVGRGEEKYIFPYQENADVMFNSATIYELCVLKNYVEPLLYRVDRKSEEYITAKRLIKFMDYFLCSDSQDIPQNSILKEFLGGSCFDVH